MAVILIATLGNRDVQLTDRSGLPEALRTVRTSARIEGEEILTHLDRYRDVLSFPMIAPVVRWLLDDQGVDKDDLYVHLFATDQPAAFTPEVERQKDTITYAEIIKRCLTEGMPGLNHPQQQRLAKRRVAIHAITSNPAHYRTMLDVFTAEFTGLTRYIKDEDRVYLEVTGGTPAMTSMMIVAGADIFGRQARCLYKRREEDHPYVVGVLQRFFERRVRTTLREQLALYGYASALATFEADRDLISKHIDRQALIAGLLTYVERRLAFDFERAREALVELDQFAPPELQPHFSYLYRELAEPDQAVLQAELIHSARVKFRLGHYADFTQRLFRFQEAAFRYLALEMGMEYRDSQGKRVMTAWAHGVPGLLEYLSDYTAPDGSHYGPDNPLILCGRTLNRVNLGAVVNFFVDTDPAWADSRSVMERLYRLSSVNDLRNHGLAGHGFTGIGKPDLEEAFGEPAENIMPLLEQVYGEMFGKPVGESPYDAVNALILGLLGN